MLQFLFSGIIAWIPAIALETFPSTVSPLLVTSIVYLSVMATCLCYILQNAGQKFTTPSTASLILSLEAVFGVLFSVMFTTERITPKIFTGFLLVFLSIVISEVKPFKKVQ